ncbi:MAG: ATP:cob(I)alamin adenosyltransferase [Verrucomicrobiota bacterium]
MTSIATKTGDDGSTGLLFNRRVSKTDPRIEANGWLDELNARLGAVLAELPASSIDEKALVHETQRFLVPVMGVVALDREDFERYLQSAISKPESAFLQKIEARIIQIESQGIHFEKWSHPEERLDAAWHLARTGVRHAERSLQNLQELNLLHPLYASLLLQSLNRLSDLFWLESKKLEQKYRH